MSRWLALSGTSRGALLRIWRERMARFVRWLEMPDDEFDDAAPRGEG